MLKFLARLIKEPQIVILRILQSFFVWNIKPTGTLANGQILLTQAASDTEEQLGETNIKLASLVRDLFDVLGLPIFSQGEVGRQLILWGIPLVGNTDCQDESNHYLDSYEVAKLQKELCDKKGLRRAIIVTYQAHLWRVVQIYKRLGFEVIVPAGLPRLMFEKDLSQWWHRRPITHYPYEFLARLYYIYKGYI